MRSINRHREGKTIGRSTTKRGQDDRHMGCRCACSLGVLVAQQGGERRDDREREGENRVCRDHLPKFCLHV